MEQKIIFKNKLDELTALAGRQDQSLTKEQIDEQLSGILSEEQKELVYQYLEQQKIRIEGWSQSTRERLEGRRKLDLQDAAEENHVQEGRQSLWPDELQANESAADEADDDGEHDGRSALEVYLSELNELTAVENTEKLALLKLAAAGDAAALEAAAQMYLPMVCDLAGEYEQDAAVPVEDLVQEGNIALWMALSALEEAESLAAVEAQLMNAVNTRMEEAMKEEMDESDSDHAMAKKVDRLHQAILSLEDDLGHPVSVEELSAFLEMPVDEINSILNLAGDLLKDRSGQA